jgi:cbb3-type cytochrome oxidase subunit 3
MTVAFIWYQISEMFQESFSQSTFVMGLFFYGVVVFQFYYILGRWVLVFPAIAIDQEPKLGWSWKQTKGNSWRMFILVGFLPLTVGHFWYLLPFIGLSEFPVFSSFLTSFVLFVFTPVEVAVISVAFRELTNWTPPKSYSEEALVV